MTYKTMKSKFNFKTKSYWSEFWSVIDVRKRLFDKRWISSKEFRSFVHLVVWITRKPELLPELITVCDRYLKLLSTNGNNFTFTYTKQVLHLTVQFLAGGPLSGLIVHEVKSGILVKVDPVGLPSILPLSLRKRLEKAKANLLSSKLELVCILSVLSIFRVLKTNPTADLSSITQPFSGYSRTFDADMIINSLKSLLEASGQEKLNFKVKIPWLVGGETSGPNSHKAIWGAEIDAIAFLYQPKVLRSFVLLLLKTGGVLMLVWFCVVLVLTLPYVMIRSLLSRHKRAELGRLSVVYNQAGKARVVAMTNWWIQLALKPLHDAIFQLLRGIPMDGTFDQLKPLKSLIDKSAPGEVFYCYDLSSATDRLPKTLQIDILNILRYPGREWGGLLDINWIYKGSYYFYSVGQPMGAYSSWAMLALTHHIVVQIAALRVGLFGFNRYCVLGDDIVIANEFVAREYVMLMKNLGVSINMSKSIISSQFAEFAKKWLGPGDLDISPVGAGLIVNALRGRWACIRLISDMLQRRLTTISEIQQSWDLRPSCIRKVRSPVIVWMSFIIWWSTITADLDLDFRIKSLVAVGNPFKPGSWIFTPSGNDHPIYNLRKLFYRPVNSWMTFKPWQEPEHANSHLFKFLFDESHQNLKTELINTNKALMDLLLRGWRFTQLRTGLPSFTDTLLYPLKPAVWYYLFKIWQQYIDISLKFWLLVKIRILLWVVSSFTTDYTHFKLPNSRGYLCIRYHFCELMYLMIDASGLINLTEVLPSDRVRIEKAIKSLKHLSTKHPWVFTDLGIRELTNYWHRRDR